MSSFVIEVISVVDCLTCATDFVGFGTRFRRRGQFNPLALGRRGRGLDRRHDSGTQSRLTDCEGFEMKRFMICLVVVAACIAGVGFYRGWFLVASDKSDDKSNVTFSADSSKMKDDEKTVVEKVEDLGHRAKDKAAPTGNAKDQTAGTAQPSEPRE
jgi:hypothetical protein